MIHESLADCGAVTPTTVIQNTSVVNKHSSSSRTDLRPRNLGPLPDHKQVGPCHLQCSKRCYRSIVAVQKGYQHHSHQSRMPDHECSWTKLEHHTPMTWTSPGRNLCNAYALGLCTCALSLLDCRYGTFAVNLDNLRTSNSKLPPMAPSFPHTVQLPSPLHAATALDENS